MNPQRVPVTGIGVDALTLDYARELIVDRGRYRKRGYVCFADVNSIMSAHRDPFHRERLERAWLVTPDGMPVVWSCARRSDLQVNRVYGPDVVAAVCAATAGTGLTHFFYGGGPGTAEALSSALQERFPGLSVAGTYTPPFRPLNSDEAHDLAALVAQTKPNFFWVGLSTPKQEAFMAEFLPRLDAGVLLGVGAAFDFLSGRVRQAPRWVQRSGLEWVFRLCVEPKRLWKRYLTNVPAFVWKMMCERGK
ncbi:MAG: WecB/TagA/CpsF family glycosyltransferase [Opitutaceae bacterium]|nr:WecB/TagA/CpsF family glycosyltransferase [Opitutaceae bacterium]